MEFAGVTWFYAGGRIGKVGFKTILWYHLTFKKQHISLQSSQATINFNFQLAACFERQTTIRKQTLDRAFEITFLKMKYWTFSCFICFNRSEFQHKSQEIFLESKRAVLNVCSMIARHLTLQFSDTTSLETANWSNSSDTA